MSDIPAPDAPDADRYEQELDATPAAAGDLDAPDVDLEVPEADAIEQAQPGPLLDEDEAPR